MRTNDKSDIGHPYAKRTKIRGRLPWFLIRLGIAAKGKDCEIVNAEHHWYKIDEEMSGRYYFYSLVSLNLHKELMTQQVNTKLAKELDMTELR